MLTTNVYAIAVASPEKELSLEQDHSQSKQPRMQV